MPPQLFLAAFRITTAIAHLKTTEITIESISLSGGHIGALVFTKAFKQAKGVSPSLYRKEFLKKGSRHNKEELARIDDFIRQIENRNQ